MPSHRSGSIFERHVITQFEEKGLASVSSRDILDMKKSAIFEMYPQGIIVKGRNNYTSIYGNENCFSEYVIYYPGNRIFRIECKWQQQPGSAYEKIPYFYLNFIENRFPEDTVIIIYGGGFKGLNNSMKWLKNTWNQRLYCNRNFNKQLKVFNLDEFIVWSNNL